jgi:hypothetical protein
MCKSQNPIPPGVKAIRIKQKFFSQSIYHGPLLMWERQNFQPGIIERMQTLQMALG